MLFEIMIELGFVVRFDKSSIIARNDERSVGAKDATSATTVQPERWTMTTKTVFRISFQSNTVLKLYTLLFAQIHSSL